MSTSGSKAPIKITFRKSTVEAVTLAYFDRAFSYSKLNDALRTFVGIYPAFVRFTVEPTKWLIVGAFILAADWRCLMGRVESPRKWSGPDGRLGRAGMSLIFSTLILFLDLVPLGAGE
jgi:hypothetical protein